MGIETPPCQDLPFHVAAAELLARARSEPLHYFAVNPLAFRPNVAFEQVASWMPTELTTSGWIPFCVAGTLAAGLSIAHRFRGDYWLALGTVLWCYKMNFTVGLVGFCLGIPLVLMQVRALSSVTARPSLRQYATLAAISVVAFYVHIFAFASCFALTMIWLVLGRGGHTWRVLLAFIPGLALVLAWTLNDPGGTLREDLRYLWSYYQSDYLRDLPKRLALLLVVDHRAWTSSIAGTIAIAITANLFLLYAAVKIVRTNPMRRRELLRSPVAAMFLMGAGACLLLPPDMTSHFFLYQRFACIAALGLLLLGAAIPPGEVRWRGGVIALLLLGHLLMVTDHARDFDRFASPGRRLLEDAAERGGRVAGLLNGVSFRGRELVRHFQDYYILEGGEATVSGLPDFRLRIVEKAVPDSVLPHREPFGVDHPYDHQYDMIEHILYVELPEDPGLERLVAGRRIAQKGAWTMASKAEIE